MSTGGAATKATMKQMVAAKQCWDHQHTEPTDIQTVVGGGDPLAEGLPARSAGALLDGGGHENGKQPVGRNPAANKKGRLTDVAQCKGSLRSRHRSAAEPS